MAEQPGKGENFVYVIFNNDSKFMDAGVLNTNDMETDSEGDTVTSETQSMDSDMEMTDSFIVEDGEDIYDGANSSSSYEPSEDDE